MLVEPFFLTPADLAGAPPIYADSRVDPLINAGEYFSALARDLERLGRHADPAANAGEFLFITGYAVNLVYPGAPLLLPGPDGPRRLVDLLIEKARRGVQVRVLAWIPWPLALANRLDLRPESADNMRSVLALRAEPALARAVCLNIVSHPAGSAHAKLVVCGCAPAGSVPPAAGEGWAAGYTGGIDLSPDRAEPNWLDVQARLEG
ncbi:MAG: hypothetical protein ACKOC5_01565, partial [Chloroflexota bacterium]